MFCHLSHVSVHRGSKTVLDIQELSLPAGAVTAVVGSNGAGKTTFLEVLALLRKCNGGRFELWGMPADHGRHPLRHEVVMVMHPGYLFHGSIWRNVEYGLRARGIDRRRRNSLVSEALEIVAISDVARRDTRTLSSGQRQRVNLARALALKPKALLLDEPSANADSATIELLCDVLKRLRDSGTTIVHTSPSNNPLADITDIVVQLHDGRVVGQTPRLIWNDAPATQAG